MRRALLACLAVLLGAPAGASAHSIIRVGDGDISYTSSDATSLNTLVVRATGSELEFRDPTVDGGIDYGSCRPGETDAQGFVIQAFCPRRGLVRIDLGEREDGLEAPAGVAVQALGGAGADKMAAAGADDVLVGGDGDDRVDGGAGADKLLAGAGDDVLAGGEGNDDLQAGVGVDDVDAGGGDDVVRVRDGLRDVVRCGDGNDQVDADTLDEVDAACEQVSRSVTAAPPGSGSGAADRVAPRLRVGARVVQRLSRVELLTVSSEAGSVAASGFLDVDGLRYALRTVRRRVATPGAGTRVRISLSRAQLRRARAALRRRRPVRVLVGVVATDAAGNSRRAAERSIRLRR